MPTWQSSDIQANGIRLHLTRTGGEWLKGSGPESDIVMCSRIRLARNLADFPFIRRCNEQDRAAIEKSRLRPVRTFRSRRQAVLIVNYDQFVPLHPNPATWQITCYGSAWPLEGCTERRAGNRSDGARVE